MPAGRYDEFDRIVHQYSKLIRWLCWMHSGGSESTTADLMQEVLVALWNNIGTLREGATSFQEKAWVRLRCLSELQHQRRRRTVETVSLYEGLEAMVSDDVDSELEQQRERIYSLAEGLTEHEREVLDLLLENYSVAEIAAKLGIKPRSVSQLKLRMVEKMKQNAGMAE